MTDIVTLLRSGNPQHVDARLWMYDAADEIERLRAEVEELEDAISGRTFSVDEGREWKAKAEAAEARVKVLEDAGEALIGIVEGIDGAMTHGTWRAEKSNLRMKDTDEWVRFYCAVRDRAALIDKEAVDD